MRRENRLGRSADASPLEAVVRQHPGVFGQTGGVEAVTLTTQQMPVHTHPFLVSSDTGAQIQPGGNVVGSGASVTLFRPIVPNQAMAPSVSPAGGSQPHENMQPYLVINYIISLFGVFPQPN